MVHTAKYYRIFDQVYPDLKWVHEDDHVIAFERGGLLFVFNFSPVHSFEGYPIPVSHSCDYRVLFSSDDYCYCGYGRVARNTVSAYTPGMEGNHVRLYLPARTAIVLCPEDLQVS
jgi:1,4-alpha-glucan branching enzyme